MSVIEQLKSQLLEQFPDLIVEIDPPANDGGFWWLDIQQTDNTIITVEWRQGMGFGISTPDMYDFGMGPDEIFADLQSAHARVVDLINTGERTKPTLSEAERKEGEALYQELCQDIIRGEVWGMNP